MAQKAERVQELEKCRSGPRPTQNAGLSFWFSCKTIQKKDGMFKLEQKQAPCTRFNEELQVYQETQKPLTMSYPTKTMAFMDTSCFRGISLHDASQRARPICRLLSLHAKLFELPRVVTAFVVVPRSACDELPP